MSDKVIDQAKLDKLMSDSWSWRGGVPESAMAHQQLVTDENGNAAWQDRLGYVGIEDVTIIAEQSPMFVGSNMYYSTQVAKADPVAGESYRVVFNETDYISIAVQHASYGLCIGNLSISNIGDDTGEPFLLCGVKSAAAFQCYVKSGVSSCTVEVSGPASILHKIPGEYIAGGLYPGEGNNSTRTALATATGSSSFAIGSGKATGDNSFAVGTGATSKGNGAIAFGGYTLASSASQFVCGKLNVEDASSKYARIVGNGSMGPNGTIRSNAYTLDWSGNGWFAGTVECTALILASSTEGSTKRFKVTVDDSGTLTATEITE